MCYTGKQLLYWYFIKNDPKGVVDSNSPCGNTYKIIHPGGIVKIKEVSDSLLLDRVSS